MKTIVTLTQVLIASLILAASGAHAATGMTPSESAKKVAEAQIRNLIEPVLEKYCHADANGLNSCKLLGITAEVDAQLPEETAPGFDEIDPKTASKLVATSATAKVLIDDKIGPVSRTKLLDLLAQYLDTLDYPVKIETKIASFPQPLGSSSRISAIRDRITKDFKATVEDLFRQFCPNQCLLADYDLQTEAVNPEEAQYGRSGEFFEDGGTAVRIRNLSATLLADESMSPQEQQNMLEMAKLRTNSYKNVDLALKSMKFPTPRYDANGELITVGRGLASEKKNSAETTNNTNNSDKKTSESQELNTTTDHKTDLKTESNSTTANNSSNTNEEKTSKQERFERIEKIERVENGDAVQAELQKFKVYGLIFACSILSLLIFVALATTHKPKTSPVSHQVQTRDSNGAGVAAGSQATEQSSSYREDRGSLISKRCEIDRLMEELTRIYAEQPKVAKVVFSRVLTEEGIETTAEYIHLFGEAVVMDMLRDPSLQSDMNELMEFYARNTFELKDDAKLELLRKLHNRTVAGKLMIMGNRSTNLFDFLADMDGTQIMELIRNESLTVKAIVCTQCDPQKRTAIYQHLTEDARMKLLSELSRIDYLPRDYIFNVANALKRKRQQNPKLNTEALPGSEVLVTLLEKTGVDVQRSIMRNLESTNPDSARTVKGKLVSIDTLRFLRDGQLLEVVLSLRHDELLQFLKGAPSEIRNTVFMKSPKDLSGELEEELQHVGVISREAYQAVERKILNRMKLMANEGLINLVETNDRMFTEQRVERHHENTQSINESVKKVAGW